MGIEHERCSEKSSSHFRGAPYLGSDTVAGAEETTIGQDKSKIETDRAVDVDYVRHADAVPEVEHVFNCTDAGCQWLCDHHTHATREPNFDCELSTLRMSARQGCSPCTMLSDIVEGRCACLLPYRERKERHHGENRGYSINAIFIGGVLSTLMANCACCAPLRLELSVSEGMFCPWPRKFFRG